MKGFLADINYITVALALLFAIPILHGASATLTKEKLSGSFNSILDNLVLAASILLSVYATKKVFFEHENVVLENIYNAIPQEIKSLFFQQDVLTYLLVVPIVFVFVFLLLRLIAKPSYNTLLMPLIERLYRGIASKSIGIRRAAGALWQIPKAFVFILLFSFALNFTSYYIYSPILSKWANDSKAYQAICSYMIYPVINSNIAKKVPVLINNSFSRTLGAILPRGNTSVAFGAVEAIVRITGGNITIIEYFNGVTLDEAVRSTPDIDQKALEIAGGADKSEREKAELIYRWISTNIKYDYDKAAKIVNDPSGVISGSITAFEERSGICFDYSCLYVSMCRAVGLKVRLITGAAYSGVAWGDHAWNQVYDPDTDEWINVDAAFGSSGVNYFDKEDFYSDHRNEEIQGEW